MLQDLGPMSATAMLIQRMPRTWLPPLEGWFKINVDGAAALSKGLAGCGGVLRDSSGLWIARFTKKHGICDASSAEEWGIYEGLRLAWDLGLRRIALESDASEVISRVNDFNFSSGSILMLQIKELLRRDRQVAAVSIPRELNRVADALAKVGINSWEILSHCPSFLRAWVDQDSLGFFPSSV